MDANLVNSNHEAQISPSEADRIKQLEAEILELRRVNARLEQQIIDNGVELEATVDEFWRAKEEADHAKEVAERAKEETERAKEAAERANTVKSAFLASMSHELRTPLNAILNFSQFLSSGMLGEVNAEQIEMLDKITSSGKHLLNLINDVLDISKIEAGSLRLFVEDKVDLEREINEVADLGRALLKEKPIQLRLDIAPDLPRIIADKRRIRQILLNLVSNACKFTETGEIVISAAGNDQDIRISVKDTGVGIAAEDFETIFETFRQTKAGARHGGGTGLGLAISQKLAEAHLGRLQVESELGVGSTFHLSLPTQAPALLEMLKESSDGR